MKKINNDYKKNIIAGKKISGVNIFNASLGVGSLNNIMNSIISFVSNSIYMNNDNPMYNLNPYNGINSFVRLGDSIKHSAISSSRGF